MYQSSHSLHDTMTRMLSVLQRVRRARVFTRQTVTGMYAFLYKTGSIQWEVQSDNLRQFRYLALGVNSYVTKPERR